MKEAIATKGSNALVLDTSKEENALGTQATALERQVDAMVVSNDVGYAAAAELLKRVKKAQTAVKNYWEPLRKSAKAAYDAVVEKKKNMLDPIEKAEKVLKSKMGEYAMELERRQREEALRQQAEAKAEAERLLNEAVEAETNGDDAGVESALTVVEVYEDVAAMSSTVKATKPKASGISLQKTWKITGVDPEKVPISFNGTEIRPVDTAAVLRLIKASKGQISIPGIEFAEDYSVSATA